jgi:hypothetical protein
MNWGNDALRGDDFSDIMQNCRNILNGIGQESVDVYHFLAEQFARGSVTENLLFQFVYRSFYGLDNAGLTEEFKKKYFELMEAARGKVVDIRCLSEVLFDIPNKKGQNSLQFSFATKLTHTVDPEKPLYDGKIAKYFRFQPSNGFRKGFANRVQPFLPFYDDLTRCYQRILADGTLTNVMQSFRSTYPTPIPDIKILDFIFWSAGSRGLSINVPSTISVASATSSVNQVALTAKG